MLVWCTKIASCVGELSDDGLMNPKPFLLENHLTVPLILDMVLLFRFSSLLMGLNDNQNTRPVCVVEDCDRTVEKTGSTFSGGDKQRRESAS